MAIIWLDFYSPLALLALCIISYRSKLEGQFSLTAYLLFTFGRWFSCIYGQLYHLHYTALPDWAQTLGMAFSIMLWMPSWGGAINGIMTLNGAWHKLRTDPVIRFLVVGVGFYGMATFWPLMAIKYINSLSHYTDWTIGHVHSGALGWVAFYGIW